MSECFGEVTAMGEMSYIFVGAERLQSWTYPPHVAV